jgi:hypothetical protein
VELLLLIAGAVAGVGAQRLYEVIRGSWSLRRSTKRATIHTERASFTPRYRLSTLPDRLRQASTFGGEPLPIVEPETLRSIDRISPTDGVRPLLLQNISTHVAAVREPADLGRFERITGRKLHDGTCCYLPAAADMLDSSHLKVSAAGFKEYLEYYISALRHRGNRLKHSHAKWDSWAADFLNRAMNGDLRLQVGCAMGLVQKEDGIWTLLQHTRSNLVAITPGLVTVMPVFGIEPSNRFAHKSKLGLLQYNILREIGEELFSIPELDSAIQKRRFDADWILSCAPVREFYDRWQQGSVEVRNLGVVINLVTANVQLLIAAIDHQQRWSNYLRQADANWEVALTDDAPSLRFRPVGELTSEWESGDGKLSAPAVLLDSKLQQYLARLDHEPTD